MKDFAGKTAVVTGAGSGIGRALAHEAASRGMNVVLADINEQDLSTVEAELKATGADTLGVPTDVSDYGAVEHLAEAAEKRFGPVHLLFNNAGVSSAPKPVWESSLSDWDWVVGVNLMSVVWGVKAFVPRMLAHGEGAHVVNTASIAGLISNARMNAYGVTKHAVVALSETLYLDLREADSSVGVSVLCPAWVKTQIHTSERNRARTERTDPRTLDPKSVGVAGTISGLVEGGTEPADIAKTVFEAVEADTFYVLTHAPFDKLIKQRLTGITERGKPRGSW